MIGKEKRDVVPSETQLYAKDQYSSIKEEADREASKVEQRYQLSERNRVIARKFRDESEDVKLRIKQRREELIREREENMTAMQTLFSDDPGRERSPEEQLRYVFFYVWL